MTATTTTAKSLAAKLAQIMGEVDRIPKNGEIRTKSGGVQYKFARDPDVLDAVRPKLAAAGIILVPEKVERLAGLEIAREYSTQYVENIKTTWLITDGNEEVRFETFGQGQDQADKSLPKAMTNSRKYALFQLFHISTGDDPDNHGSNEDGSRGSSAPRQRQGSTERLREAAKPAEAATNGHGPDWTAFWKVARPNGWKDGAMVLAKAQAIWPSLTSLGDLDEAQFAELLETVSTEKAA